MLMIDGMEDGSYLYKKRTDKTIRAEKRRIRFELEAQTHKKIKAQKVYKPEVLTKDHIIPQSFLNELRKDNIKMIPVCENRLKGDRLNKEGLEKIFKAIINHF